ncbi:MAG: DNA polymerase, partial [Rickettsiales bacterium]|nr:DNA polymerase [Rickettsiales bacterium]
MHTATNKRLFIVDGYSYIFRAYHSLPPLTSPLGVPVGAVYGFTNMILKLKNKVSTNNAENIYLILVFDSGKDSFRNEIYAEYKANRPDAPDDLKPQFAIVREAAIALNLEPIEVIGFEADDIIASYAKKAKNEGFKVTIVSVDKDLMQLVDEDINMYDPMRDRVIGIHEVVEKFGVTPDKVLDVLSLMGDSSDNVPGVPGIGIKTAAELINQYQNIDNLINGLSSIKQEKRRKTLEENIDKLHLSKKLISLDFNVELNYDFENFRIKENDEKSLFDFASKYNFKSLLSKVKINNQLIQENNFNSSLNLTKISKSANSIGFLNEVKFVELSQPFDLISLFNRHLSCEVFINFTEGETSKLEVNFDGKKLCYINITNKINSNEANDLFDSVKNEKNEYFEIIEKYFLLGNNKFIFFDAKNLIEKNIFNNLPKYFDDIKLISYLLNGSNEKYNLDYLISSFFNEHIEKDEQKIKYFPQIYTKLKNQLFNSKQNFIYYEMEIPLISVLLNMQKNGIKLNIEILKNLESEFNNLIINLTKEIYLLANSEFNIASPKQLGEILFEKLKLPAPKKTKSGQYVTDSDVLENLSAEGFIIAEKILEFRSISKLLNTYIIALQKEINSKTKRVHTNFNNTSTTTGRLSSINPNLQNIPIKTEEGRRIRKAFIAEEGKVLIGADYSQI